MEPGYVLTYNTKDSSVQTSLPITLVLYVPPPSQSPLFIVQSNGQVLSSNAFLIPRWGGIIISNPPSPHLGVNDLKPYMQLYIAQLRELLGIKPTWNPDFRIGYRVHHQTSRSGVTEMELDMLVRSLVGENLENAQKTLVSLVWAFY